MNRRKVDQPLSKKVEADQDFVLADDYAEEYKEAKVTLDEEQKETFDLGESQALAAPANAKPYSRRKQFPSANSAEVEQSPPSAFQPGLIVRRLKRG